jgi:hypothetical protein
LFVQVFDDRQRVMTCPSCSRVGTRACGLSARYAAVVCSPLSRWMNRGSYSSPFRFSAMRTR